MKSTDVVYRSPVAVRAARYRSPPALVMAMSQSRREAAPMTEHLEDPRADVVGIVSGRPRCSGWSTPCSPSSTTNGRRYLGPDVLARAQAVETTSEWAARTVPPQ